MARQNIIEFMRDVGREAGRVTWPTRKETLVTTAMVFVMILMAAVFFLVVDQVLALAVSKILGIGG